MPTLYDAMLLDALLSHSLPTPTALLNPYWNQGLILNPVQPAPQDPFAPDLWQRLFPAGEDYPTTPRG